MAKYTPNFNNFTSTRVSVLKSASASKKSNRKQSKIDSMRKTTYSITDIDQKHITTQLFLFIYSL